MSPTPARDRDVNPTVPTQTEPTESTQRVRRPPSNRLLLAVSAVCGLIDGWLVRSAAPARVVGSAVFMAVFVYWGLRLITKARFAHRPERIDPSMRDPSKPPPAGGWANQTASQRYTAMLRRSIDALVVRRRRG